MKYSVAFLLLAGLAQAALLSQVQESTTQEDAGEDLMIKMPEAVTQDIIKAGEKAQTGLSLVQAETTQQVGMFESGVLHASLKPILKAKVKKVANFIHAAADEYAHGTEDQKKGLKDRATSLIMQDAGVRGYNPELCNLLWSTSTEFAGVLSWEYCPSLTYPTISMEAPPFGVLMNAPSSRERSAFLSQMFWSSLLASDSETVKSMLSKDVCYYWGGPYGYCGKYAVELSLPYIGFPDGSATMDPVFWHCDSTTCLLPVTAWSWASNYVLTTFGTDGMATEVIVPLTLWR